jgi:hypothetical protein
MGSMFCDSLGQAFRLNRFSVFQNHSPLNRVFKFTDLSRPRIPLQQKQGSLTDSQNPTQISGNFFHKMPCKFRYVFRSFTQRRQRDRNNRKRVVQIGAKTPVLNQATKIPIGGSDYRMSTGISVVVPTRRNLRSCNRRSSLNCITGDLVYLINK